jgi:hypothetical protein
VENRYSFAPPRKTGLLFHSGIILLLGVAIGVSIWQLAKIEIGPLFFIDLVLVLFGFSLVPMLVYRAYALWGAYYTLERDGIHLHWGLRIEDIPTKAVRWVYPYQELKSRTNQSVPLPWLRLPGGILGIRHFANNMPLEFMASSMAQLVLIATEKRIFAISPNDPQAFLNAYRRFNELGSITPIQPRSVYPSLLLNQVWRDRWSRYIILAGLLFNLLLLGWVSLVIPGRSAITLGIFSDEPSPSVRLLLLPFISGFFFLLDFVAGLFFYRRDPAGAQGPDTPPARRGFSMLVPGRVLAFILWGVGLVTVLFFFGSVYLILLIE